MNSSLRGCPGSVAMLAAMLATAHGACAAPPASYRNPLSLQLADGAPTDNCADPAIIREQGGAQAWFLYCTTDPIDKRERERGRERDGAGWKFHLMPTFRSTDLLNWRYVGDAFTALPPQAAPKAGLWAPEPQYIKGRYHLYFSITDVLDSASPEPNCTKDSAIAVATSASPAGPWRTEAQLVVAPRRAGPDCSFHWTIDPEVIVTADGRNYLYYGSYGGGMFVQRLSADGLRSEGAPRRIGAADRYEGAEVVQHNGKWYLFASATDCCKGPLTGYALFVGRADNPEGPFLDRQGNDMAAPRVGGTPVLMQNGNRWVGPGHNTVFRDDDGQWWTIFHAIDRAQPYFSAPDSLTRRVALLERIDWVDGWPRIAGGAGPSDEVRPGPGAPVAPSAPSPGATARQLWSEPFDSARLAPRWRWLRRPDAGWSTGAGLRLPTQAADLHHDSDNAAILNTALPAEGNYRVELRMRLEAPGGCCAGPVQAGLVVYRDDDNYVKLVELAAAGLRQIEFAKELFPVAPAYPRYGNTVLGAPGAETWLRLDVRRAEAMAEAEAVEHYTAYSSQDGRNWVGGAVWTHRLGDKARLGLVAMGGTGQHATFSQVRVSRLPGSGSGERGRPDSQRLP